MTDKRILSFEEAHDMLLFEYHRHVFPIYQKYCEDGKFNSTSYPVFQQEIQPFWEQFMRKQQQLRALSNTGKKEEHGNTD